MVINTPTQLKDKTRNLSQKSKLNPQEVQQMYFFERIIDRISQSVYADNFILKGGLLVSALNGIASRTTMDMDATIRGIRMEEEVFASVLTEILQMPMNDNCEFTLEKIDGIRADSEYQDFRAHISVSFGSMRSTVKMDVTTGDAITPHEMQFFYPSLFSEQRYPIKAYPLETVLAEKYETLCSRGDTTTRARDFYDIFMLYQLHKNEIDWDVFPAAVMATARKRGSADKLPLYQEIFESITNSAKIRNEIWPNYCRDNLYVDPASFDAAMDTVMLIGKKLGFEPERKVSVDDEISRINELRRKRLSEKKKDSMPDRTMENEDPQH